MNLTSKNQLNYAKRECTKHTVAQAWARERNLTKGRIVSMKSTCMQLIKLKSMIGTETESLCLIINKLSEMINHWEDYTDESNHVFRVKLQKRRKDDKF